MDRLFRPSSSRFARLARRGQGSFHPFCGATASGVKPPTGNMYFWAQWSIRGTMRAVAESRSGADRPGFEIVAARLASGRSAQLVPGRGVLSYLVSPSLLALLPYRNHFSVFLLPGGKQSKATRGSLAGWASTLPLTAELPAGHAVRLVIAAVKQLGTSAFHAARRTGGTGAAGYAPVIVPNTADPDSRLMKTRDGRHAPARPPPFRDSPYGAPNTPLSPNTPRNGIKGAAGARRGPRGGRGGSGPRGAGSRSCRGCGPGGS
jgi:hypothetical protein